MCGCLCFRVWIQIPIRAKQIRTIYEIEGHVKPYFSYRLLKIEEPTWAIDAPMVNMDLNPYPKAQTPVQQYKALFTEMIARNFSTWERIYTDGFKSADGVGAAAGWGEIVRDKALPQQINIHSSNVRHQTSHRYHKWEQHKKSSNIFGLVQCSYKDGNRPVWRSLMRQLQHQIYANKKTCHQIQICWISGHCNIIGNEKADQAAKQAAKRVPSLHPLPYTDFYPVIRGKIRGQWASALERSGDKLREIKDNVKP